MRKYFLIISLLFFAVFFTYSETDYGALFDSVAEESTSDDSGIANGLSDFSPIPDFKMSLYGEHKFDFHIPVIPDFMNFEGAVKAPKFLNEFGLEIEYKDVKLKSAGKFDVVLNDFGSWDKVLNIKPLENYISWSPWKIKLAAGLQVFSWGTADGLNPTDNINSRDYTVGANSDKIPILSAAFSMYPVDFFSFDVVYVPFEQNDIFPRDIEAEIPEELFYGRNLDSTADAVNYLLTNAVAIQTGTITSDDIAKEFAKYMGSSSNAKNVNIVKFEFEPKNFTIGGKTNFRFPKVDFSFSYLYDFDPYYTPELTLTKEKIQNTGNTYYMNVPSPPYPEPVIPVTIPASYFWRVSEVKLVRNRIHRIGTDVKASIDRFGLWGEFCFNLAEDYFSNRYTKRNHKISYVAGMDFSYGPNDDFYFNFQYFGEVYLNYDLAFYDDYEDGMPDSSKVDDQSYMKRFYYRAMVEKLGEVNEGFLQGVSLKMKWPVLDNLLTPSLAASYILPLIYDYDEEKRYGSLYFNTELDIMPVDSFHIIVGTDLYFSWVQKKDQAVELSQTDKIGTYHKDSNIYIAMKYKWGMDFKK